ncbi:MAG: hypothetical protein AB7E95_14630, partial [Kiritimatiellales bacterium]
AAKTELNGRSRDVIHQVIAQSANLVNDPSRQEELMAKIQAALDADGQVRTLRGKLRMAEIAEYTKISPAFAELEDAVYGNTVAVPSLDAKVAPLPKSSLRDQIQGPLGKPVPPTKEMLEKAFRRNEEMAWRLEESALMGFKERDRARARLDHITDQMQAEYGAEFEKIKGSPGAPEFLAEYVAAKAQSDSQASNLYEDYLFECEKNHSIGNLLLKFTDLDLSAQRKEHRELLATSPSAARVALEVRRDIIQKRLMKLEQVEEHYRDNIKELEQTLPELREEIRKNKLECDQLAQKLRPSMSDEHRAGDLEQFFSGYADQRVNNSQVCKRLQELKYKEMGTAMVIGTVLDQIDTIEEAKENLRKHGTFFPDKK